MNPLVRGGLDECYARRRRARSGTHMLVVFAPQIAAVRLRGRAVRRPAGAPALHRARRWRRWCPASLVIGAYLAYVPLGHGPPGRPRGAAAGRPSSCCRSARPPASSCCVVTAGVAAATAAAADPARRCGSRRARPYASGGWRSPGLPRSPRSSCPRVAVVMLSGRGTRGALADYQYAWALFLLPWAVLAVPIATSAFPLLSARIEHRRGRGVRPDHRLDHPRGRPGVRAPGRPRWPRSPCPSARFLDHDAAPCGAGPRGARVRARADRLRPRRASGPGAVRLPPRSRLGGRDRRGLAGRGRRRPRTRAHAAARLGGGGAGARQHRSA